MFQSYNKVVESQARVRADFDLLWKVALGIGVLGVADDLVPGFEVWVVLFVAWNVRVNFYRAFCSA